MNMEAAFAPAEAHYRSQVLSETFGHVAPEPGAMYTGTVIFACAAYGGSNVFLSITLSKQDGTPLQDNPWSYEDLVNYVLDWVCDQANGFRNHKTIPKDKRIETDGKVFRFNVNYTRFKNNNCRISGTFTELALP